MTNPIPCPRPITNNQQPTTSQSPVLATEDRAAYDRHCRQFLDEYQPATPTETQLTQELADTAWRLNRIPLLEAELLSQNPNPQTLIPMLATLGLHYARLSRQFQKAVDKLREIQAERRETQERDLKRAAGLQELHKRKGIPYDPSQDGFVFSNQQIEDFAQRRMRLNESRETEYRICHMLTPGAREKSAPAGIASYGTATVTER
jgi:hypothetical protein